MSPSKPAWPVKVGCLASRHAVRRVACTYHLARRSRRPSRRSPGGGTGLLVEARIDLGGAVVPQVQWPGDRLGDRVAATTGRGSTVWRAPGGRNRTPRRRKTPHRVGRMALSSAGCSARAARVSAGLEIFGWRRSSRRILHRAVSAFTVSASAGSGPRTPARRAICATPDIASRVHAHGRLGIKCTNSRAQSVAAQLSLPAETLTSARHRPFVPRLAA